MIDKDYIEELKALEDKKEQKTKLSAYAEQFGVSLKKTKSFENMLVDLETALAEMANEPVPEVEGGLSISDLIDADDALKGEFVIDEPKEEATLLFDAPVVQSVEVVEAVIEAPAAVVEVIEPVVVEPIIEVEPEAPVTPQKTDDMFELPAGYSPTLIQMGKGGGYCTLPWWIYEWITQNPDWKQKPKSFPHAYGEDTLFSLIYYIKRDGQVRIRETRNSRFFVLN